MSLRDDLLPDESVLCRAQLHWIIFMPAVGLFAVALYGAPYLGEISLVFQVAAVGAAILAFLRRLTTQLWITDRRVLRQEGILNQRTEEMRLEKLVSFFVGQGVPGRLLGYGTITVHGTVDSWEPILHMDGPRDVRHVLAQAIRRPPGTGHPAPAVDSPDSTDGSRNTQTLLRRYERDAQERLDWKELLDRVERLERIFRLNLMAREPSDSTRLLDADDRAALIGLAPVGADDPEPGTGPQHP